MMNKAEQNREQTSGRRKVFCVAVFVAILVHLAFFELFSVPPVNQDERSQKWGRVVQIDPSSDLEARRLVDSLLIKRPFLPSFESDQVFEPAELEEFPTEGLVSGELATYEPEYFSAPDLKIELPLPAVVQAGSLELPELEEQGADALKIRFADEAVKAKCSLLSATGKFEQELEWSGAGNSGWAGQLWVAHVGISANGSVDEIVWLDLPPKVADVAGFENWLRLQNFPAGETKRWYFLNLEWGPLDD